MLCPECGKEMEIRKAIEDIDSELIFFTCPDCGKEVTKITDLAKEESYRRVEHPPHYTDGKIEVIDFIEDKGLGFHLGNVVKYVSRAGKKDPDREIEDLKKAQWYLKRYIEKKEVGEIEGNSIPGENP